MLINRCAILGLGFDHRVQNVLHLALEKRRREVRGGKKSLACSVTAKSGLVCLSALPVWAHIYPGLFDEVGL